tara:strand:- start:192 stop:449 length:258 start_codon:yes stop_codon:yes gene_type:complete
MKKQELKSSIINEMLDSGLGLLDLAEVLANVFVELGSQHSKMNLAHKNKLEIVNEVIKDMQENGETLSNALARQGLLILTWLEKK